MSGPRVSRGAPEPTRCLCERVPVLCGCGWGSLAVAACAVPEFCPLCGFGFWQAFGMPDPCEGRHPVTGGAR